MIPRCTFLCRLAFIVTMAAVCPLPLRADKWWDGDPATANAQYGPASAVWDVTTNTWLPSGVTSSPNTVWVNDGTQKAQFGSSTAGANPGTLTLTLALDIKLTGIDMGGSFAPALVITNSVGNAFVLNFGSTKGDLAPNNTASTLTIDVVMTGTNGISKRNGGTVILTQNNTYTGGTTFSTINQGTIQVGNGGTTGALGGGAISITSGSTIAFNRSDNVTVTDAVSGAGTLVQANTSTLTLNNAANSIGTLRFTDAGTIEVLANAITVATAIVDAKNSGSATLAGTGGGAVTIGATSINIAAISSGTLNVNATIQNGVSGNDSVTINGSGNNGTVIFGAANTYTGTTTLQSGTLRLNAGSGNAISGDLLVQSGANLTWVLANQVADTASITANGGINTQNKSDTVASLTLNTSSTSTLSGLNITGLLTVTQGTHDAVNSSGTLSSGQASLSGGSVLRLGANSGGSTWNIGAGGLTMNGSTILFGSAGSPSQVAKVNLSGNVTATGTNAFSINTGLPQSILDLQGAVRTFDVQSGTTQVDVVVQNGGITKSGNGILLLGGANTYTQATTVNGGTLVVNGIQSAANGAVTVNNGGQLSGTGTVGGATTIANGGVLNPGNPTLASTIGTLSFNSSLTLASGSTTTLKLAGATAGQYDRLVVATDLAQNTGGQIQVTTISGFTPQWGQSFDLLDWSGTFTPSSNFGFNPDGSLAAGSTDLVLPELSAGWYWDVSQFATDGIITVAPEPSRAFLLVLGCGLMWRRRRR